MMNMLPLLVAPGKFYKYLATILIIDSDLRSGSQSTKKLLRFREFIQKQNNTLVFVASFNFSRE